jgi:hypothetical protein
VWGFFVILFPLHRIASPFFSPFSQKIGPFSPGRFLFLREVWLNRFGMNGPRSQFAACRANLSAEASAEAEALAAAGWFFTVPVWFDFVSFATFAVQIHPFAVARFVNRCGFICYAIFGGFFSSHQSHPVAPTGVQLSRQAPHNNPCFSGVFEWPGCDRHGVQTEKFKKY